MKRKFAFIIMLMLCLSSKAKLWVYQTDGLSFNLWIPDDVPVIKGVYCVFPYMGGDTRPFGQDFFTDIAEYYDFAYMGISSWVDLTTPAYAKIIVDVLDSIAKASGRPELCHAPMVLTGTSMGGRASYYLASYYPERTIAYSGYRPAIQNYDTPNTNINNVNVPALVLPGQLDYDFYRNIDSIFCRIRGLNGQAAMIPSWGTDHGDNCSDMYFMQYYFVNRMIETRYPWDTNPLQENFSLRKIPMEEGWLADHRTWKPLTQMYKYNNFPSDGIKQKSSWLPTEDLACLYKVTSTWRDTTMTCISEQNKLIIAENDHGIRLPNYPLQIKVLNHGISGIDSIYIYEGNHLMGSGKSDSLVINVNQKPGMYLFWGKATDTNSKEYFTTTMMTWTGGGKYNPFKQPAFTVNGNVSLMINSDSMVVIEPQVRDSIPVDYYSLQPINSDIAELEFDSITGTIKLHASQNKYGSRILTLSAHHSTGLYSTYDRAVHLSIQRDLSFKTDSIVELYKNSADTTTVLLKPTIEQANISYSISPKAWSKAYISINDQDGTLKLHPFKQTGLLNLTLTATDKDQPENKYARIIKIRINEASPAQSLKEEEKSLLLYPNPAKEILNLRNTGNTDIQVISLYNTMGKLLYNNNISLNAGCTTSINLSTFPKGCYILKTITENKASYKNVFIK
jgi:hypothetical protein